MSRSIVIAGLLLHACTSVGRGIRVEAPAVGPPAALFETDPGEWAPFPAPTPQAKAGSPSGRYRRIANDEGASHLDPVAVNEQRARLLARAAALVGRESLGALARARRLPNDCTGFVRLAYLDVGVDLMDGAESPNGSGVEAIYGKARKLGALSWAASPKPGDLVFFHETYDRNRDGRRNDGLTHVGIVEGVDDDGTIVFLHRANSGVRRSRLNLHLPHVHRDAAGQVLNDYLRSASPRTSASLTGELFSGYAAANVLFRSAVPTRTAEERAEVAP